MKQLGVITGTASYFGHSDQNFGNSTMQVYQWKGVINRLKYHRQRLKLSKDDCKFIIDFRYGKKFCHLSDEEIIDFGTYLSGLGIKEKKK